MSWSITLDRDELDRVAAVLGQCPPVETSGDGVWVRHQAGVRMWEAESWPVVWQITVGSVALDLAPRCLPGRLVWHAAELARHSTSGTVTLSVPDDYAALVESDIGSAVIDLPSGGQRPALPRFVPESASATITVTALYNLLQRARVGPIGVDSEVRPLVLLAVETGTLVASVDWTGHKAMRSTYRIPATTTGTAQCRIPSTDLMDLLRYLEDDEDVTIGFPSDADTPLLVSANGLRATVARRQVGAGRHHDEFGQYLADVTGAPCSIIDRGVFLAEYRDWSFLVELRDTPGETICISTTLGTHVADSAEVWREMNALNARLVRARVWFDEGEVRGGVELPYDTRDALGVELEGLRAQLDGFDVFLAAFSNEPFENDEDLEDRDELEGRDAEGA